MQVGCGVIINKKSQLLLVKKNKGSYKGKWEFPGGKREQDETIQQCVEREIREELNCRCDVNGLIVFDKIMFDKDTPINLYFYDVEMIDNEGDIMLSDEHSEYKWVGIDEIQHIELLKWDYQYVKQIFEFYGIISEYF